MKRVLAAFALCAVLFSCSSGPEVKQDQYAKLSNQRTFTDDLPVVWNGILSATSGYKIASQDIDKHILETDWVETEKSDKYEQAVVNGSPVRIPLHTRVKYKIAAQKRLGGVDVTVNTNEQVESLDKYGNSKGYSKTSQVDTALEAQMLDKINQAILSGNHSS